MAKQVRNISLNIYADTDEEAERGRKAMIKFISIMGQHGAMVSGDKLHEAISHIGDSPFVMSQIIKFFKK
jgi:hypothetical protein